MRGFRRVGGTLCTLSFGPLPGRTHPGVACVASSKALPRAVDRNRFKRTCRATLLPLLPLIPPSLAIVVVAKKTAGTVPAAHINEEIYTLLQKGGVLSSDGR